MNKRRDKTAKELEQEEKEELKEKRTKKLFKQLQKDYGLLLYDIAAPLVEMYYNDHGKKPVEYDELLDFFTSHQQDIIQHLIQQLESKYYNDNYYYCSKEEFYNLTKYYTINYKPTIKKILAAMI